jgi:hypothetical protein
MHDVRPSSRAELGPSTATCHFNFVLVEFQPVYREENRGESSVGTWGQSYLRRGILENQARPGCKLYRSLRRDEGRTSYCTTREQLVVACVVPAVAITWKLYVPAGVLFDFEADDDPLPPQPNGSRVKPASARIIQ